MALPSSWQPMGVDVGRGRVKRRTDDQDRILGVSYSTARGTGRVAGVPRGARRPVAQPTNGPPTLLTRVNRAMTPRRGARAVASGTVYHVIAVDESPSADRVLARAAPAWVATAEPSSFAAWSRSCASCGHAAGLVSDANSRTTVRRTSTRLVALLLAPGGGRRNRAQPGHLEVHSAPAGECTTGRPGS